ncbi:MAG: glycosyltransferase family 4 protein [Candidatus Aenigmarchaeota archaeon]|jgi:glycosyltransferase involved in cell wall biosynthesis|nr:glycosyltransferase family 4 protein [Candidatus Aenigmarchaeota archaeon]
MRIAFFCWEFWPWLVGGLGTYAIEITKKFVEMGHEVVVFTLNDGNLPSREDWNGIEIHRPLILDSSRIFPLFVKEDLRRWGHHIKFFSDIFAFNYLSASKFVNQLVRKEKRNFDIVSFHDWLAGFAGIMIKDNTQLPTVFHIHSIEEQRSLGGGSEVVKEIEREAARKADKIITVSYSMKEFLENLGYPREKLNVVYNGIDVEKYSLKNVNWRLVDKLKERYKIKEERVILFIGRLTWIKGVTNLIRAMPEIVKDFPNVKLVILGKGESYSDLIQLKQSLGLGEKVEIRSEWVSEEERIAHYALADVCVFPSISEPFGIVSLEAMSMERPVVVGARGISGLREQVIPSGEERCGVHVNGEDPHDIAWGIRVVLENYEEAKKWGKNGRKRVIENFTIERTAKETLKIYESLI